MKQAVFEVGAADFNMVGKLAESWELDPSGKRAVFKLRQGVKIGTKVTLRRQKMWFFLDKLFNIVLPRIRDFRGLSAKAFDGRGNYAMGLKEQIIFPEIDYDKVDRVRGMNICIVTTANTDEEGAEMLRLLGCPIQAK